MRIRGFFLDNQPTPNKITKLEAFGRRIGFIHLSVFFSVNTYINLDLGKHIIFHSYYPCENVFFYIK